MGGKVDWVELVTIGRREWNCLGTTEESEMSMVVKAKKEPAPYLPPRQECHAQDAGRRSMMPMLAILDTNKKGRQAEELENKLHHLVIGQDEAIHQIVRAYQTHLAGLTPAGRPIGNFLFLGPTGSGKTRIVEATAESLLKNSRAVIKIDCAEFQHSHEIAKLIGSPPGYLGHRETLPLLSQEA